MIALGDRAINEERTENAIAYYRMSEFFMYDGDPDKKKYYLKATVLFYQYYADYFEGENPIIEKIEVPFEGVKLPVMHTVPETKSKGIILIHGGNDSYFEEFLFAILYLREMGFEVYMFEGPGQRGVMRVQGMHFTHEWEKPVKAVLDYFGLDDVTIIGISLGGYLAPRAAAFDKRIKRVAAWSVFPCFQDVIVGMQKPDCGAGGRADVADERENVSAPYLQSVQPVATRKENAVRRLPLGFKNNYRVLADFQQRSGNIQPPLRSNFPEAPQVEAVHERAALAEALGIKERVAGFVNVQREPVKCRRISGMTTAEING